MQFDLHSAILEAMAMRGCPVCRLVDSMVYDEMCQLQRQALVNPLVHADVIARGGYCADHFWQLEELASPVTNAQLLAPLMDRLAERLTGSANDLRNSPPATHAGPLAYLGGCVTCRLCQHAAEWQTAVVDGLLTLVNNPEHQQRYIESDGLCLPHLSYALNFHADRAAAQYLLRAAVDHSRRLGTHLRKCVTKWKQKDRQSGPEDAAPYCAVQKLVGSKRRRGQPLCE
jgi:hypothetical protein